MKPPYSYRADRTVPAFDDSRPLFVFDGTCVLCSSGAAWIMQYDRPARIAFTPAQGPIGKALYRHYGLAIDDTYLFLVEGRAYGLSEGYFRVARVLAIGRGAAANSAVAKGLRLSPRCAQPLPMVRHGRPLRATHRGAAQPPVMNG